ncbi:MAG: pilus assembly PilX N-terminal domain-containing protein [Deltaproteobacteria bacterium]|nr:pilus assembly PilX N-terminal domain-containing protein [Deltaproteobacteria bacterium]
MSLLRKKIKQSMRLFDRKEEGTVLIMALLLMAVMSIIGFTASMTSRTEITISYNTRVSRQAFYAGDSGIEISPKIVSRIIEEGAVPNISNVTIHNGLRDEIMGYFVEDDEDDQVLPTLSNPDVSQTLNVSSFSVDIDRDPEGAQFMPGGGVQFASGAEGIGTGSLGGVLIYYDMNALGMYNQNPLDSTQYSARSHIDARYRKVVGAAGGM